MKIPVAAALSTVVAASGGCGLAASSNSFSGKAHDVAQAISNLQSAVSSRDEKQVCSLLSAALRAQLNRAQPNGRCWTAIKLQLKDVDSTTLKVDKQSDITIHGSNATARVEDTLSGNTNHGDVLLLHFEKGAWKIAGLA